VLTESAGIPGRRLALLLVAACLIPFANGLGGGFTYDDKAIVRDDVRIRSPETLGQIFETPYFGGPRGSGSNYRPIMLLSFAIPWWVFGGNPIGIHAVNLLLHVAATLLLWRLWRRLGIGEPAAFAAALLFAVHPIHVEAVTSLVGRGETLAALFTLLFLEAARRWLDLEASVRWRDGRRRRGLLLAGAVVLYLLALLTKESAAAAPLLALLLFWREEQGTPVRRGFAALRRGAPLFAACVVPLAAAFTLRSWVLGGAIRAKTTGIFEVENPLVRLAPPARVANAALILLRYVGRFVFPLRLSADESAWSIRPVRALSVLGIAAVVLLAAAVVGSLRRPESPLALGFLFFLGAFLPASNLLLPIGTIFAERVAYLPSAGLCLIAAVGVTQWQTRRAVSRAPAAVLAAAIVLFAARTATRNTVWWNDEALFENCVRTAPESAKNHYNLGWVRAEDLRFREGRQAYRRAIEIYEPYWDAWAGKGRCERGLGRLEDARRSYEKSLQVAPFYENGFFGLGLVLEDEGKHAEAAAVYRRGLAKNPKSLPLSFRLAIVSSRLGDPRAGEEWTRALLVAPSSLMTRLGYAEWLWARGRRADADRELREVLRRAPRDEPALRAAANHDGERGFLLGEALATEKVFHETRSAADLARLVALARRLPDYGRRFDGLRGSLERRAPWAFRALGLSPSPEASTATAPG
jgi:protein O-mannosyl-transferase